MDRGADLGECLFEPVIGKRVVFVVGEIVRRRVLEERTG